MVVVVVVMMMRREGEEEKKENKTKNATPDRPRPDTASENIN